MTRIVLVLLGVFHLAWGVPAVVAPRWFFDHFPGFGFQWTAAYPPYNEHLMTDVGAAATTFGVLLLLAAAAHDVKVTRVVLTGIIVFSALHLGYHVARHGALHGTDLVLSLLSLILGVIVPLGLLVMTRRTRSPQDQPS
ncbi:hypothetical protein [Catelliglobosispora koreensis]|uniref:hypothetical protein n=1 Tax=Catelliglobosispora koreensis TaxID=129052 RepID=UPI00035C6CDD|nr:hypothetical protein [Catelliglobosispora koreensis]